MEHRKPQEKQNCYQDQEQARQENLCSSIPNVQVYGNVSALFCKLQMMLKLFLLIHIGKKTIPTHCCFSKDGQIIAAACQVS